MTEGAAQLQGETESPDPAAGESPYASAPGTRALTEEGDLAPIPVMYSHAQLVAEGVLRRMPPTLAEARRLVSVELWTLPRPEDVQVLVRLGEETEEPAREFARSLVALRLIGEQELREFWDPSLLDHEVLKVRSDRIREILFLSEELQSDLDHASGAPATLESGKREFLREALKVLQPRREEILAAAILGPAITDLLRSADCGDLDALIATLTDDERRAFLPDGAEGAIARPLRRTCLEVLTVRWLVNEDYLAWESVEAMAAAGGIEEDVRDRIKSQCRDHEYAFKIVSDRLQALQAAALRTGQKEHADLLHGFRRSLQATHSELNSILRPSSVREAEESTDKLSLEFDHQDESTGESLEAVIGRAVGDLGESQSRPATTATAAATRRKTNWWRIAGMSGITAVLAVVAVLVNMYAPAEAPPPIQFGPTDARNVIVLTETDSIGTMLRAEVAPAWASMEERDQIMQLDGLGRLARDRGFTAVVLVDQNNNPVGEWTTKAGTSLVRAKSPS